MPTIRAELRFPSTSTSRANELYVKLPQLKECTSSRSPTSSLTRMKWVQSSSMKGRPKRLEQGSRPINHTNLHIKHQPVKLEEQLMPASLQMEACSQSRGAAWSLDLTMEVAKQLAHEQNQFEQMIEQVTESAPSGPLWRSRRLGLSPGIPSGDAVALDGRDLICEAGALVVHE